MIFSRKKPEKRAYARHPVKVPVKFRSGADEQVFQTMDDWRSAEQNGFTLDLSLGGMSLVSDHPLTVGEVLRFDVYLLDQKNKVSLYAAVRWVNEKNAGIRFIWVRPKDMDVLKEFIQKLSSAQAALG